MATGTGTGTALDYVLDVLNQDAESRGLTLEPEAVNLLMGPGEFYFAQHPDFKLDDQKLKDEISALLDALQRTADLENETSISESHVRVVLPTFACHYIWFC